jgi:hypothetical protein
MKNLSHARSPKLARDTEKRGERSERINRIYRIYRMAEDSPPTHTDRCRRAQAPPWVSTKISYQTLFVPLFSRPHWLPRLLRREISFAEILSDPFFAQGPSDWWGLCVRSFCLCARSKGSEGGSRCSASAGVGPGNVEGSLLFSTLSGPKLRHERACANPCPISLITLRLERPSGSGRETNAFFTCRIVFQSTPYIHRSAPHCDSPRPLRPPSNSH